MASVSAFARLALCLVLIAATASAAAPFTLTSWRLSSSASFPRDAHHNLEKELSTTNSALYGKPVWYNATGPATVMAALQQSNTFKDPYHADNILKINSSMFAVPWYYSTVCTDRSLLLIAAHATQTFILPEEKTPTVLLTFKGVNYKANVWLNGQNIANSSTLVGTFRY